MISGINPKAFKSDGMMYCNRFSSSILSSSKEALNPTACRFNRLLMILSIPEKAPPAMNKISLVSTSINFCSGCFLPPLGATLTTVPSNNFNKACCTPSPETSLVIEGLSPFLAILSISSIKTIPRCAFSKS